MIRTGIVVARHDHDPPWVAIHEAVSESTQKVECFLVLFPELLFGVRFIRRDAVNDVAADDD